MKTINRVINIALGTVLSIFVFFNLSGVGIGAYAADLQIPEADVTYEQENWPGTLEINSNTTVKISGITHESTGDQLAPIKICDNSTVNLVFEGDNVLTGNAAKVCAGIEVEEGSTVNIYGLEGASMIVTGGKYSAGIGGKGYNGAAASNPKAGNIHIYSGKITAIGGEKGAGIGSGFHSSASDIVISGGDITAKGTGGGAGIGSGYGTSGGAHEEAEKVGFYNGGNITITGGVIKAASYNLNFDNFDPYDSEIMYGSGYDNTFAAGIGGGYGSSSGIIIIGGDADVTAIGSCGGAGIGTGRGTNKEENFDSEKASCSVTIGGNAKVISMATADNRPTMLGDGGGAGIGLGRGFCVKNESLGSVVIKDNASVYAYADADANGIGTGYSVAELNTADGIAYPDICYLSTLTIGDNCKVIAISNMRDQFRTDISENMDQAGLKTVRINLSDDLFENDIETFSEDRFPMKINVRSVSDGKVYGTFAIQDPHKKNVGIHVPVSASVEGFRLELKDYRSNDGKSLVLQNDIEKDGSIFKNTGTCNYDIARAGIVIITNAVDDSDDNSDDIKKTDENYIPEDIPDEFALFIESANALLDAKINQVKTLREQGKIDEANRIAAQGILIESDVWVSFHIGTYKKIEQALKLGIPVRIKFVYAHVCYSVTIPANTNIMPTSLCDKTGWCGFLNLLRNYGGIVM